MVTKTQKYCLCRLLQSHQLTLWQLCARPSSTKARAHKLRLRGIDIMDLGIYTTTHLKTDHSATTAYTTSLPLFLRDSTRTHFMSSKSGHALSPQFIHQIYTAVTPQISITSLACHEYIESGSAPRLQCTRPPQTLPFHTSTIA